MAGRVKDWLDGNAPLLRWLAFEDYARRIFGNDHPGWYREPMRYAAGIGDANKVLGSQVVTFDFGAVFAAHAALAGNSEGADRISAVIADDGVASFCNNAIAAMAHQLSGKADLVLQLPSPSALLALLGEDPGGIDFDMLDDTNAVLADLLRGFSELPIAALVLSFQDKGVDLADEGEACQVLQSVTRHYDWQFALRLDDSVLTQGLGDLSADIWLMPTLAVAELSGQGHTTGGGLNRDFWEGGALPPLGRVCLYGDVPADLDPKFIVERVANLPEL